MCSVGLAVYVRPLGSAVESATRAHHQHSQNVVTHGAAARSRSMHMPQRERAMGCTPPVAFAWWGRGNDQSFGGSVLVESLCTCTKAIRPN